MLRISALTLLGCMALAATASGSTASSVWNDNGDIHLSAGTNRSVVCSSDIFVEGQRVVTEAEAAALLAPLIARVLALEAQLLGACASQPCQNGATCAVAEASFACSCAAEFTGPFCAQSVDECASSPCQNGATCLRNGGSHACTCASGFTGSACDVDVGGCVSSPCQNGATCSSSSGGAYSCACASGFTGVDCMDAPPFISVWETITDSSTITLPLMDTGSYNAIVDWGDSSATDVITAHDSPLRTHTFALAGTYTITITGIFVGLRFGESGDMERIREIQQWGSARVGNHSAGGYFYGCTNLKITATDALDLTGTTILRDMFRRSGIDHRGNLAQWDTKDATDMSGMFTSATAFNQSLPFDTSSVTTMNRMFFQATSFNQPLNFDTSRVTDMSFMFWSATSFNQDLSHWCVSLIPSTPPSFDSSTPRWALPRPVWSTCP